MKNEMQKPFAVVTGASSGIGLELARQFAKNGYDLLITATRDLSEVARELRAEGASEVQTVQADLRHYDGVESLYREIKSAGRPVDAIAVNAGVGVGGEFVNDTSLERELDMINLNVVSTVHLTKRVAKDMVERGEGRILITSSIAGTMPTPFQAVYGATKAFDLMFAEAIRNELKDTGVTVTALLPGATDTPFFERADLEDTKVGTKGKSENDPADVARQGFEALMAGKDMVVAASLVTKMRGLLSEILPETTKAQMERKESEPGSARKSA